MPPRLGWELELWSWFQRLATGYPQRISRGAFMVLIAREHWDEEIAFALLFVIETGLMPAPKET